jgi:hypothetical protein
MREYHLEPFAAHLNHHALPVPGSAVGAVSTIGGPGREVVDELGLDPAGVDPERAFGRRERGIRNHGEVERDDGGYALDHHFLEGAAGPLQGLRAAGSGDDELGEHGVEVSADDVTLLHAGVNADAGAGGVFQDAEGAGGGHEVPARVLAGDAELEGVAADFGVVVAELLAAASRNCSRTRSMPVTSSETQCSTCRRVLTSRKEMVPSWPTRNSHVPAPR